MEINMNGVKATSDFTGGSDSTTSLAAMRQLVKLRESLQSCAHCFLMGPLGFRSAQEALLWPV